MRDLVSNRWVHMVALTASALVAWVILIPPGSFWTGFALLLVSLGVGLGVAVLRGVDTTSRRSIAQVIDDLEREPARVGAPVAKTVL